ncbi:MAG: hypothetical protein OWQ48_01090 [Desulfurococcus sp.]|nr:hypothetical protein [Desulfurococcus sp.]
MAGRLDLFLLLYTGLVELGGLWLYLLGEKRATTYLAVNILVYLLLYSILKPIPSTLARGRLLTIILFTVFMAIVAYRVYEVLSP